MNTFLGELNSQNILTHLQKPKTDEKSREKITEKKVKNKIVINPPQGMTEAIEEMGGQILEMVEIEEGDFPKELLPKRKKPKEDRR